MNIRTMSRHVAATLLAAALAACGGGGSDESEVLAGSGPDAQSLAVTKNSLTLQSDAGDYIGDGKSYSYTQLNAVFDATAEGGHIHIAVYGDESWSGEFQLPNGASKIKKGLYKGAERYPLNAPDKPGLDFTGEARGCSGMTGSFTVNSVTYTNDVMTALNLSFEQHCDGQAPALKGQINWKKGDKTAPPGPVNPPPKNLWAPAAGRTPTSGNYVYYESDAEDYIGHGRSAVYTQANARLSITTNGRVATLNVVGDENWSAYFQAMSSLKHLAPGFYSDAGPYLAGNPTKGQLDWSGDGAGCAGKGWFVVDRVIYQNDAISALDLRFEQHCEGAKAALRGQVHWIFDDKTSPPGPMVPPPSNLWQPRAGSTPVKGNYAYFDSEPGDYVGQGRIWAYTPSNAQITVTSNDGHLTVNVMGDAHWHGIFSTMDSLTQIEPGYYGELKRDMVRNPVRGGMDWDGGASGCNDLTGWLVVDSVDYANGVLQGIDLRFEQHCESADAPPLHGKIHWRADDKTLPPQPINPPPGGLWKPEPGSVPKSGNYVYLNSGAGDYIGQGQILTYSPTNSQISLQPEGRLLSINVNAGSSTWHGSFEGMVSLKKLQPGYYSGLTGGNPVLGDMNWSGEGRGCSIKRAWFAIDKVVYSGATLSAIDLRFGHLCYGSAAALHGQIHWSNADTTQPAGPINPPPSDLWAAPAGSVPATGNYVYLIGEDGDGMVGNQTLTYTLSNSEITAIAEENHVGIGVMPRDALFSWNGGFTAMSNLSRLESGYYGNVERDAFRNPAFGGLDWNGMGRDCNTVSGWFAVDKIVVNEGVLSAIDLRFEQHCNKTTAALRGQIHWTNADSGSRTAITH